jgi:hypothetical protein
LGGFFSRNGPHLNNLHNFFIILTRQLNSSFPAKGIGIFDRPERRTGHVVKLSRYPDKVLQLMVSHIRGNDAMADIRWSILLPVH